jgi:hypothetical protein
VLPFGVVPGDNPVLSLRRSLPFSRSKTTFEVMPMPILRCFLAASFPLSFELPEERLETSAPTLSISNSSDDRFLALRMGAKALGGEVGISGSGSMGGRSEEGDGSGDSSCG